jgi:hypothetical protein
LIKNFEMLCCFIVLLTLISSCAKGKRLSVQQMGDHKDISGVYNVIFYGARHHDDLLTVAIRDRADDPY